MSARNGIFVWIGILVLPAMFAMGCETKTVFVTDGKYQGDMGGLVGADAICQAEAEEAGLTGTYKAWLSDSNQGPDTRFTQSTLSYTLADGSLLAGDWADLTDGSLLQPIDLTASGAPVPLFPYFTWTNTWPSGAPKNYWGDPSVDSCRDWTSLEIGGHGYGDTSRSDYAWTNYSDNPQGCDVPQPLYCFQQ